MNLGAPRLKKRALKETSYPTTSTRPGTAESSTVDVKSNGKLYLAKVL
jgi:hypothetical protein